MLHSLFHRAGWHDEHSYFGIMWARFLGLCNHPNLGPFISNSVAALHYLSHP